MQIVCPSCATSYDVETATLRPDGRQVRCVRCRAVWRAELSQAEKLIAAAEALAPVRRMIEAVVAAADEPDSPPPQEHFEQTEQLTEEPFSEAASDEPLTEADIGSTEAATDATIEVDSPSIAPVDLDEGQPQIDVTPEEAEPAPEPLEDVETVAARRYRRSPRRRRLDWPLSRLQTGILALIIIDAIVVGWRTDFVRALPQTASFYSWLGMPVNLRGLAFDGLATATEQHEGVPILVVDGNIVSTARNVVDVPRLRFAVRNAARQEIYSWTAVPPRAALPPGEAAPFHTRLASPPPDAHDVLVRFVNRYDIVSGAR